MDEQNTVKSINGMPVEDEEARKAAAEKLGKDELTAAVEDALTQAKESGEFDGEPGSDATVTGENIEKALGYTPADKEDVSKLSEAIANLQISGLTTEQVNALDGMFKIASFTADPTAAYSAFKAAFGIEDSGEVEPDEPDTPAVTLTSISATYSGGDVAVGTALADLSGIVVTATYSDGSTATVADYTLSGEIAEGSNTITVTYQGKTAAITVTGVVAVEPLYGVFWPPKGAVTDWSNHEWAGVENFAYTGNSGDYIDAGFPTTTFVRLDKLQGTVYIRTVTRELYGVLNNAYQMYANADGEISTGGFVEVPRTKIIEFDNERKTMDVNGTTYKFVLFKFEIPAGQYGYFASTQNVANDGYFISADKTAIDEDYRKYYTLFTSDPSDRITEGAVEVS